MRSLATRESGAEIAACVPEAIRRLRAAGFDLVIVETSASPGRRGMFASGGRVAVRDDAGVRRREPARENLHARFRDLVRHQQSTAGARGMRLRDVRKQVQRTGRASAGAGDDAGVRHHRFAFQRRRGDRASTRTSPQAEGKGLPLGRGVLPRSRAGALRT